MTNTTIHYQIIDYKPEYLQSWKEINEAWIKRTYIFEEIDRQHCNYPEETILANGGQILLAVVDGIVVGTAGLLKDNADTYELIKMAVAEDFQGKGIGKALCLAAIERARNLGAALFYLFSNTKGSGPAIELYRKLGFAEVPLDRQDFERADIRMEMWFPEVLEKLRYPIGRFETPKVVTTAIWKSWIGEIETLPSRLQKVIAGLTDEQFDTPYRPAGWTVRQLVHHLADSHINAQCRLRLALTENNPTIKPYEQDDWARLADVRVMPVSASLDILRGLHARWAFLLKTLSKEELKREFFHPEHGNAFNLEAMTGSYAWHGNHHLAQIQNLREKFGWAISSY